MEPKLESSIKSTVISILSTADMDNMTEAKVRKLAGEKLDLDLSTPDYKKLVRNTVESFLISNEQQQQQQQEDEPEPVQSKEPEEEEVEVEEEEEEEEETKKSVATDKEYDDEGDLIICRLSNKRRVTLQDFKGKTLVSIREYYEKDGKQLPSSKGISLTAEQWSTFSKSVPSIEESIKKMQSRLR